MSGIIGYLMGAGLARRSQWKQKESEAKLRDAAMPDPAVRGEMSLVPPLSSYKDHFEYGRMITKVQFHDTDLEGLNARITKLEFDFKLQDWDKRIRKLEEKLYGESGAA
jgi:hypothetical protein